MVDVPRTTAHILEALRVETPLVDRASDDRIEADVRDLLTVVHPDIRAVAVDDLGCSVGELRRQTTFERVLGLDDVIIDGDEGESRCALSGSGRKVTFPLTFWVKSVLWISSSRLAISHAPQLSGVGESGCVTYAAANFGVWKSSVENVEVGPEQLAHGAGPVDTGRSLDERLLHRDSNALLDRQWVLAEQQDVVRQPAEPVDRGCAVDREFDRVGGGDDAVAGEDDVVAVAIWSARPRPSSASLISPSYSSTRDRSSSYRLPVWCAIIGRTPTAASTVT